MEQEKKSVEQKMPEPTVVSYIALVIAILIFSGIFAKFEGPLRVLDFSTLIGKFGKIAEGIDFQGKGGVGARQGFVFAFSLAPTVMAALGIVQIVEQYGGLAAGAKLLTGVLRFIMGIPGVSSLALVASISSSDAGAAMTSGLVESGLITPDERDIFVAFQFPGSGTITNYFSSGAALFGVITVGTGIPLLLIFILKIVGANLFRFLVVGRSSSKSRGVSSNV